MLNLDIKYINEGLIEDNTTIMFTVTNTGYLDYTRNMLQSLKKFNIDKKMLIVCLDENSNKYFKEHDYFTLLINVNLNEFAHIGTESFSRCCYIKLMIFYKIIMMNYNVFYIDGDIFFMKNPIEELIKLKEESDDLWIQNDSLEDNNYSNVCAGFLYIKSNDITKKYFNINTSECINNYNECKKHNNDQTYINIFIKPYLNTKLFPLNLFPNGQYFYNYSEQIKDSIVMVHFNWVVGNMKKENMKQYNMWLLD
jgi:hypothetical protein